MIVETLALYAEYQRAHYSWEAMLSRLGADGAGIERLLSQTSRKKHHVLKWLAANDCRASYEEEKQIQYPGLSQGYYPPGSMRGDGRGLVVLLGRYTGDQVADRDPEGRLLLIRKRGSRMSVETLEQDSYLGMAVPGDAIAHGRYISVFGIDQWGGNSPRVQVSWYRRSGEKWQWKGALRTDDESWGWSDDLRLAASGSPKPVEIESRTYPDNLSSCHATMNLSHTHRWVWRNGWREASKKLRETPFNALDKLYLSIERGREREIRQASLNGRIARQLLRMKDRLGKKSPEVRYPESVSSVNGTVIGVENLNATLHFTWRQGKWKVSKIGPLSEST